MPETTQHSGNFKKTLASKKYVDLTHVFAPGIPRWPGFPDETRKTIYWYDKRPDTAGTGFFTELFTHVGQWGTHVDPPAHFIKGLRTVDQIDLKEMILPLVIIDVHEDAAKNPDYRLSIERLKKMGKRTWADSGWRFWRDANRLGQSAGPIPRRWKTKTRTASHIIRAGACPP